MDEQAPYGEDVREQVTAVATWLASQGFQRVECGPAEHGAMTVRARWQALNEQVFCFDWRATARQAMCSLWAGDGELGAMQFHWMLVQNLAQVQVLLTQNRAYWQAREELAARAALRALHGQPAPA